MSEQTQFGREKIIRSGKCSWFLCNNEFLEPARVNEPTPFDLRTYSFKYCDEHEALRYDLIMESSEALKPLVEILLLMAVFGYFIFVKPVRDFIKSKS